MAEVDEHGRPEPPLAGDEAATLVGFLDYQRATLAWKCRGLDAAGMRTALPPSTITLGGLLKHLAYVEDDWFTRWLLDEDLPVPWCDHLDGPDWEWTSAAQDAPDELFLTWQTSVTRSRAAVRESLARGPLDQPSRRRWPDGRGPSLRWILCHMIEEYARHNGHADLIREVVDGETGE